MKIHCSLVRWGAEQSSPMADAVSRHLSSGKPLSSIKGASPLLHQPVYPMFRMDLCNVRDIPRLIYALKGLSEPGNIECIWILGAFGVDTVQL